MSYDPDRTAVVVVDMQNGFCHPDGSLYAPASEDAIRPVNEVLNRGRDAGASVVFTRDVHPPEQFEDAHYYDEFDRWGEHVLEGSWEAELHDDLDVREEDHVVVKHTYDAFYRTDLEGHLESHGIDDLVICGTLANVCVLHTAGSAGLRDYRPVLVKAPWGISRRTTGSTPSSTPTGCSARRRRWKPSSSAAPPLNRSSARSRGCRWRSGR